MATKISRRPLSRIATAESRRAEVARATNTPKTVKDSTGINRQENKVHRGLEQRGKGRYRR